MSPWKSKKKDRPDADLGPGRNYPPQVISRSEIVGVIRKTVSDIMTQQMTDFEHKLMILANANTAKLSDQIQYFQVSTCRHIENLESNIIKRLQMYDDRSEKDVTAQVDVMVQGNTQRKQENTQQVIIGL